MGKSFFANFFSIFPLSPHGEKKFFFYFFFQSSNDEKNYFWGSDAKSPTTGFPTCPYTKTSTSRKSFSNGFSSFSRSRRLKSLAGTSIWQKVQKLPKITSRWTEISEKSKKIFKKSSKITIFTIFLRSPHALTAIQLRDPQKSVILTMRLTQTPQIHSNLLKSLHNQRNFMKIDEKSLNFLKIHNFSCPLKAIQLTITKFNPNPSNSVNLLEFNPLDHLKSLHDCNTLLT